MEKGKNRLNNNASALSAITSCARCAAFILIEQFLSLVKPWIGDGEVPGCRGAPQEEAVPLCRAAATS